MKYAAWYFLGLVLMAVGGCTSVDTPPVDSSSEAREPSNAQCTGKSEGAACTGATAQGKEVLLAPNASNRPAEKVGIQNELSSRAIHGRCELLTGGKKPMPCSSVKLVAKAIQAAEIRTVMFGITGWEFRVDGLSQQSYTLESVSPEYKVIPEGEELTPGQTINIQLKKVKR